MSVIRNNLQTERGDSVVRTDLIRGKIAERGLTFKAVAKALKQDEKTFGRHMAMGKFDTDDVYTLIELLGIEDIKTFFFSRNVPLNERNN